MKKIYLWDEIRNECNLNRGKNMAEWVSHLIVADRVLEQLPSLKRHEFCVGNIAPDCNIPNENWTEFTPSRQVTHWMQDKRKQASDSSIFYEKYIVNRMNEIHSKEELSFLLGYYSHLITDAELQCTIRDENRVAAAWERAKKYRSFAQRQKV